jgi:uncharacterized protein YpmS
MKWLGIFLILLGLGILIFVVIFFFNKSPQNLSPILEDEGVKVIYETPTK